MSELVSSTIDTYQTLINELHEYFETPNKQIEIFYSFFNTLNENDISRREKLYESIQSFCVKNRDALNRQDVSLFNQELLKYSNKIYINMKKIIETVEDNIKQHIWTYLLKCSAYTDPAGNAKNTLKDMVSKPTQSNPFNHLLETEEDEKIKKIIEDILNFTNEEMKNIDTSKNPLDIVVMILSSPTFKNILENIKKCMNDGSLDVSKIVIIFQKLVSSLQQSNDNIPNLSGIVDLIGPLIGNMVNIPNLKLNN